MAPGDPVTAARVRAEELRALRERRRALFPGQQKLKADYDPSPLGLAFSGGGIRSATFNLGVLQGLAERGILPHVDYLSTVSGGGYIGSWLHSIIRNRYAGDPRPANAALDPSLIPGQPERDPVAFLRKYSNYLAPHLGVFSPDFWTIASVWLRNMSLNLLILIPFLAGCVLTVLLAGILQQEYGVDVSSNAARDVWVAALAAAVLVVGMNLRQIARGTPLLNLNWGGAPVTVAVVCSMVSSYILGAYRFEPETVPSFAILLVLFFLLQWVGGFPDTYRRLHPGKRSLPYLIWIPLVSAALSTVLMRVEWDITSAWTMPDQEWLRIAFGPPLILATWTCGIVLQIGLMGSDFPDASREWLATFGAKVVIGMTAWIAMFVLAVYGPYWLAYVTVRYLPAGIAAAGGWILSGAAGYFAGNSRKTSGEPQTAPDKGSRTMELVAKIAPVVFLAGFLLFVSLGTHLVLRFLADPPQVTAACVTPVHSKLPNWLQWLEPVQGEYWCFTHTGHFLLPAVIFLWLICVAIVVVVSLRLNINEFSMHHFYKNRLVRCYLGAGRADIRRPNSLTGFDPADDFAIASMLPAAGYLGPYPLVNCALNLNTGSELAQQERRGASFVFTPRYCGFEPSHSRDDLDAVARDHSLNAEGYRPTPGYMYPDGPNVGTAMAISGAAANPNSGYHTSAPLAFLMTILNVRLGWWLGNPRRDGPSARPGPLFALGSLLAELLALSNGRSSYVNVSDGGHFDNLGLYELVRRRCPFIIAGDAEADPELHFEGLGGAIRKCRADFGVEIDLDPATIRRTDGFSGAHCVVGSISYPAVADEGLDASTGWILYLKSSLTGDESEDVRQYHATHDTFPHESTANQFFTESQFESYRKLGLHVVRTAFENVTASPSHDSEADMRDMFCDLFRKWYPAPRLATGVATNLTERYAALMRRVVETPTLSFLDNQLFEAMPAVAQPAATPRDAIYFCIELIQLMEDVYFELNFQHRADRENPVYAGWLGIFNRWARSRAVGDAWAVSREGFNVLFQEFFDELRAG
jgi:hypothetical protein